MKKIHAAALAALIATASPSVLARDLVVGLSPDQGPNVLKSQVERIVQRAMSDLELGQNVKFFDAKEARLIGVFEVPEDARYSAPRARLNANKPVMQALKAFIDAGQDVPGRQGEIDLPALLRAIGSSYPAGDGADLVILGLPIHDDPRSPSASMAGGAVPGDGHVLAAPGASPYGTQGFQGRLAGYDVYLGYPSEDWVISGPHKASVERLWGHMIAEQSGSLLFFDDDLNTLFGLLGRDAPDSRPETPLVATEKLEMIHFERDTGEADDLYTASLEVEPPTPEVVTTAGTIRMGIKWDCASCDLDLYVRPAPPAEVIYYGNASTPEGRLFKDFLNSPSLTNGFETVELTGGSFDMADIQTAVNFFGGSAAGGVSGELRIAVGEQVWAVPFAIEAQSGNSGRGSEEALIDGAPPNAAWVIMDPMVILKGN